MSDKYHDTVAASSVTTDDGQVKAAVEKILAEHKQENMNQDVYRFLFNTIDLTTLNSTDSNQSVAAFVERVNAFDEEYPQLKNVAAICVYPNFAELYAQCSMCPMWTSHACRGDSLRPRHSWR